MPDKSHSLKREKRVLITRADEKALADLLHELSSSCGTRVTLSDLLRSAIHRITSSKADIISRMNGSEMQRPASSDHEGTTLFRVKLCAILFGASVSPPPPGSTDAPPENAADAGA